MLVTSTPILLQREYVYAMICKDKSGQGYLKIGVSPDPLKRITTIQANCPLPLHQVALLRVASYDRAKKIESDLCAMFEGRRDGGGWFKFSLDDITDKAEFNKICRRVFLLHTTSQDQRWWDKLDTSKVRKLLKAKKGVPNKPPPLAFSERFRAAKRKHKI